MAKKFGKFLLFTAAIGAAGAAAYYYMQKKDAALLNETDEDYDDFSEDVDDSASRTYVPLSHENAPEQEADASAPAADSKMDNFFTPLAEKVSQAEETLKEEAEEAVEEFFDEDAPAETETETSEETGTSEETETSEEFFDDEDAK